MAEMTKAERDRLAELAGKTQNPASVPLGEGVRGEGDEIEFRRLSERAAAEERLDVLRKQPARSAEDIDEMRTLGAEAEEVAEERRKLAAAEADAVQVEADELANLPSQQRRASERLAREADAVQARERAARSEPVGPAKVRADRIAVLRAMRARTPDEDEELRVLEAG